MPFVVIPMVPTNILKANGDALVPSAIMVAVAVINLALDLLLIFGLWGLPRLEVEGAAWASLIARAITAAAPLAFVILRERLIDLALPPAATPWATWRRVLAVGLSAALGSAINPLGIAVVTAVMAGYGTASVAAFGAATRGEAFAAIPTLALSSAPGPMAGRRPGGPGVHPQG